MTNRTADVYPYDNSHEPLQNVPTVSGATTLDVPRDETTYILKFNEPLGRKYSIL